MKSYFLVVLVHGTKPFGIPIYAVKSVFLYAYSTLQMSLLLIRWMKFYLQSSNIFFYRLKIPNRQRTNQKEEENDQKHTKSEFGDQSAWV